MMRVIVTLAVLVAYAVCEPLCSPDQLEGFQQDLIGYIGHGDRGIVLEKAAIHYDAKNQRTAYFVEIQTKGQKSFFSMISLYKDGVGKQFFVNKQDGKCRVTILKAPFKRFCVPEDAKFDRTFSYGPANVFEVSSYTYVHNNRTHNLVIRHQGDSYIPVEEALFGTFVGLLGSGTGTYEAVQTMRFTDMTTGIKDESVFDLPDTCKDAQSLDTIQHLRKSHLLFGF